MKKKISNYLFCHPLQPHVHGAPCTSHNRTAQGLQYTDPVITHRVKYGRQIQYNTIQCTPHIPKPYPHLLYTSCIGHWVGPGVFCAEDGLLLTSVSVSQGAHVFTMGTSPSPICWALHARLHHTLSPTHYCCLTYRYWHVTVGESKPSYLLVSNWYLLLSLFSLLLLRRYPWLAYEPFHCAHFAANLNPPHPVPLPHQIQWPISNNPPIGAKPKLLMLYQYFPPSISLKNHLSTSANEPQSEMKRRKNKTERAY